jgi:hypothetical protein
VAEAAVGASAPIATVAAATGVSPALLLLLPSPQRHNGAAETQKVLNRPAANDGSIQSKVCRNAPLSCLSALGGALLAPFAVSAYLLGFGGLVIPVLTAAQENSLTTAFFEKNSVSPRDTAKLRATVLNKTIAIKALASGAIERVYYGYGAKRVDSKGATTKYQIVQSSIQEEYDGVQRMLLIYDWNGQAYICLDNVGDLDEIGEAAGTCPYVIVATTQGDHTRGNTNAGSEKP